MQTFVSQLPQLSPGHWALAILCAVIVGVAKTGVPGVGILAIPLMVLVAGDARTSAGWLLPLLCIADCIGVAYYRRHADVGRLFGLLPWVLLGMAAAWFALGLPDLVLRRLVGITILAMIAVHVARQRRAALPATESRIVSASFGMTAGFATTVANAAGPVMGLYLLGRRLPKDQFIATGAWFFLVVNLIKVPLYIARGMVTGPSLIFDVALVPAILLGALGGRVLVARIPQRWFETVVFVLTGAATVLLFLPPQH